MLDPYTGEQAEHLFDAADNRGLPGSFGYWRGPSGHVFLGTVPKNLGDYYAGGYQDIPGTEAELAKIAEVDRYRLDPVRALVPVGRFLEIGPWIGLVAYSAKQAGYEVSALEMDERCVALLNQVGVRATRTSDPATTLAQSGETFDVIGLWHSIEHLPRPWAVINAAAAALNPGGLLVVAAPNPESAQMRVLGRHWLHLDAPRHLHLMTAAQFEEVGQRCGLETVSCTCDDQLGEVLDRNGWQIEVQRRLRGIPGLRSLARLPLHKLLRRRHRRPGALDGAGFTLMMRRPIQDRISDVSGVHA